MADATQVGSNRAKRILACTLHTPLTLPLPCVCVMQLDIPMLVRYQAQLRLDVVAAGGIEAYLAAQAAKRRPPAPLTLLPPEKVSQF